MVSTIDWYCIGIGLFIGMHMKPLAVILAYAWVILMTLVALWISFALQSMAVTVFLLIASAILVMALPQVLGAAFSSYAIRTGLAWYKERRSARQL